MCLYFAFVPQITFCQFLKALCFFSAQELELLPHSCLENLKTFSVVLPTLKNECVAQIGTAMSVYFRS